MQLIEESSLMWNEGTDNEIDEKLTLNGQA